MKNKFLSLLIALSLILTPAFAEETPAPEAGAETPPKALSVYMQENIIRSYAHLLADNYYYGASDANLLYNVICMTIENGGIFDIDRSLEAMIKSLGDEYAEYYSPEEYAQQTGYYDASFFGIGVTLAPSAAGTEVENVFSGSSAEMAGIMPGDIITAVDGEDVSKLEPAAVREKIVGEEGSFVEITLKRGEEKINVRAVRQKVTLSHSSMKILENNIGYIDVQSFTSSLPQDFDSYIKEFSDKNISKVIIDLRDNGGGDLNAAIEVAKKLLPAGLIGKLKYKDESRNVDIFSENLNAPNYKMLVLVNENTASASEFLAMALQSRGRAKLLGAHTYGKGCMQVIMEAPTGSGLKFTVGEYFSPKDERVHKTGLNPDIEVENIVTPVNPEEFEQLSLFELDSQATKLGIEQRLNALRLIPDSEVDGIYNDTTAAAVRVFQQYSQLEATGDVDLYTAIKINDFEYTMNKVIDVQMEKALEYFN